MNKSQLLQKASLGGSVFAAVTASLCCIGPLLAALVGAGGFAAASSFEKWRPLFLAISFVLLAAAWFLIYRKPKDSCEDQVCAVAIPRWRKVLLIVVSVIVVLAATFPYWTQWLHRLKGTYD